MKHLNAEQQRWLMRIILKGESGPSGETYVPPNFCQAYRIPCPKADLKISVREKTVLAVYHPDAQELFNVSSDLKRVCWTLIDKEKKLETGASPDWLSHAPFLIRRLINLVDTGSRSQAFQVVPPPAL
jgi:hypothetical protein